MKSTIAKPKNLFLLDGLGALLSAFLLGVVLVRFEDIFGIPSAALYFLAFIPCVFAVYDFFCYYYVDSIKGWHLKLIGTSNLIYCITSLAVLCLHWASITKLGIGYVVIELIIVAAIGLVELRASDEINR